MRQIGELSKVVLDPEYREYDGVEPILTGELAEPAPEETVGEEVSVVDEWLLTNDRGMNGERPEAPPLQPSSDPLTVDIDDGHPDTSQNRLGALKRVDTTIRVFSKYNRHTDVWE